MLHRILAAAVCLIGVSAFAGDAGCGLGSMILKENSKLSQTCAATTNGSFATQLFGITTGTSNCTASSFVRVEQEARVYAEANLSNLKVDMARGQGESLTAFAQILGCHDSAVSSFGGMVQSKYDNIFPNSEATPDQVVNAIRLELSRNKQVATGCGYTI